MNIMYPNYENSLVNLTCSVLKYYGIDTKHNSIKSVDELLSKDYKNVVLLLLDGLGTDILEKDLPEDSFLRRHYTESISSVFPPTTVAATTSLLTGLTPCEHSRLGWTLYFKEIDEHVNVFTNTNYEEENVADYSVVDKYLPCDNIARKIVEKGIKAYALTPYTEFNTKDIDEVAEKIQEICNTDDKKFIYAYTENPDKTLHKKGTYSEEVKDVIKHQNDVIEEMCSNLKDTLLIVLADHGHININGVSITDYPNIYECLERLPAIEPRALAFYVKEDMKEKFELEFNSTFGDKFKLMNKQEVIDSKIFGTGIEHEKFSDYIGDYIAVATDDLAIFINQEKAMRFKSTHAGLTKQEMEVPLIVYKSK